MKPVKLIIFDIDGVLTDGKVYIFEDGHEAKAYRLTEIDSLNEIKRMGFLIAAVTGEDTPIVNIFKKKIEWDRFVSGCKEKFEAVEAIASELGVLLEEIVYIGDGKYDIEPIKHVGLGMCPDNAIRDVKEVSDLILQGRGGENCIQELERYLRSKNGQENI